MLLFQDIMRVGDFNFDNSLFDENSYGDILVYDISCKTFMGAKGLRVRFHKVNRFIKIYDSSSSQILFATFSKQTLSEPYSYIIKTI